MGSEPNRTAVMVRLCCASANAVPCNAASRSWSSEAFELGWAGPVEHFRASVVKDGCGQFEDLRKLADKLVGKKIGLVDQQNGPTERVESLQVLLAGNRIERTALGFCRKPARYQRCRQETEERNPILGIRDREGPDRREEEPVECQGGGNGGRAGLRESPQGGDDQNKQQVCETDRGRVHGEAASNPGDQGHPCQRER